MLGAMSRDRDTQTVVTIGIGIGVGYAIYRLLQGGAPAGAGPGSNERGSASATWPTRAPAEVPIEAPAVSAPAPARPPDVRPVEIRVQPSSSNPTQAIVEMEGRIVSVGELIARIDAGGRRDVLVAVRGDTREGGWTEIRDALLFSGIQISLRQPAARI